GYPQDELRAHDPLDVDAIDHFLDRGLNLAGKLDLAEAERAALALGAGPTEEEAHQLPQGVEAEATRHHRITLEMTRKKPQVRLHSELGSGKSLAMPATLLGNFADPLEHQHRRQRQLGAAGKQFAAPAGEQVLEFKARTSVLHSVTVLNARCGALTNV